MFMCIILSSVFGEFDENATIINLDTSYRDWNNTFPSVSVCLMKGRSNDKVRDYINKYWDANRIEAPDNAPSFYRAIHAFMFLNYEEPFFGTSANNCLKLNETCGIDMNVIRKYLMPSKCTDFMHRVTFLGETINCENIFERHETQTGVCFIANSLYKNKEQILTFKQLPLHFSNQLQVERSLRISYIDLEFANYKIYVHSPEEIPNLRMEGHILRKAPGLTSVAYKMIEIENEIDVKEIDIERRKCQFPDERVGKYKFPYSISNCKQQARIIRELEDCNCTLPVGELPADITPCGISNFGCISASAGRYKAVGPLVEPECSMPSCVAMEIAEIGKFEEELKEPFGVLEIDIMNKPTLKYIRRVGTTTLDMIVNVGGLVGLFLGASILSILEFFFLIFNTFMH